MKRNIGRSERGLRALGGVSFTILAFLDGPILDSIASRVASGTIGIFLLVTVAFSY